MLSLRLLIYFVYVLFLLWRFRVELFDHRYRTTVTANLPHPCELRCDNIQNDTSPTPTETVSPDSQPSWYYAIFVRVGASSVEMKSSDDDKYCVGPHKPQIPTDSWK